MLQSQKYPNNSRTISGAINIVRTDDATLLCNTSSGIVGLSLQEIPDDYYSTQYKLYVVDLSANASTNNITINAPSGHTINGASSFVINANSASVIISIVANKTYICQYSVIGGGGGITQAYQTVKDEGIALTQRSNINFIGSGVTATDNAVTGATDVTILGGGITQAYQTAQNEGIALTQRSNINFIGSGVTAADDGANSRTNVTVQAYNTIEEEGTPLTQRDKINFIGSGVTATDDGANSRTNVTVQAYNTIEEEGTPLVQRSTLNFIGNGATLSDDLANTKSQVVIPGAETFVCFLAINSTYQPPSGIIPFQVPSSSPANYLGLTDGQIISKYVAVASDNVSVVAAAAPLSFVANANLPTSRFGTFDNTTGVFTTSVAGTYLISGSCHFKPNNSTTVFWQTLLTGSIGLGLIGTGNNIYSGNYMNVSQGRESQVDITSTVIAYLPASTPIRMSILNMTDRNYDGTVYTFSDGMRFSITKLT